MAISGNVYPMRLLVNNTRAMAEKRNEWGVKIVNRRLELIESLLKMKTADAQIIGRRIRFYTHVYDGEYKEEGQTEEHVQFARQFSGQFTIQERRKVNEITSINDPDFRRKALNFLAKKRAEIQTILEHAKTMKKTE